MRIKENSGTSQWLVYRAMSTKEDFSKGVLSWDIYDCDSSSLSSDLDTSNAFLENFPFSYNSRLSDNSD